MSEMGARDLRLWAKEEMAAAITAHAEEIRRVRTRTYDEARAITTH